MDAGRKYLQSMGWVSINGLIVVVGVKDLVLDFFEEGKKSDNIIYRNCYLPTQKKKSMSRNPEI